MILSFVHLFPLSNPFNPTDIVEIKGSFTNNKAIPIETLNNSTIILTTGLHTFRYIVNGIPCCIPTKLTIIDNTGKEFHYIEVLNGQFRSAWVKLSKAVGDIDI